MDERTPPGDVDFAAVFAALPGATAVFAVDPPRFTVLAASDALLALARRPRDAVVGRPLAEAFPNARPEQASGFRDLGASLAAVVRTGAPERMERQRYDFQRPDGTWETRYWDAVNIPVPGPDGAVRYLLHQTAEVTAQVREEETAVRAERILERMGDAHCVLDRAFRIVSVNAATERVLGVPRAALLGRSHWEVFPASASEDSPVGRALRRVVAEGLEQHLSHHYTGEGYDLHLDVDAYPTEEGGVAMFWRDVSERVRAEAALRESEEKYRTLFNEMDEGFALCELVRDADGRVVDYRYVDLNRALVRHANIEPDALRGRRATEVFPNLDPWLIETYQRVVEEREPVLTEHYYPHVDLWLRINAFPRGGDRFAVLYSNVSQRKRAEEALRESERRYRLLFENMGDGFALCEVIRDEHGRIVDWRYLEVNRGWEQTGVPVSQTVGRTAREVNPEIEPEWIETYGRVVETGLPASYEAFAKGFGKWFDTVAFRHSENRFGLIFRDVTERKAAEADRRASEARRTFLLKLSDAIAPLDDAEEIRLTATQALGRHLGANRVAYAEDCGDGHSYEVAPNYVDGVPDASGRYRYADFGPDILTELQSGRTRVQPDIQNDGRLGDAEKRALASHGVGASLNVPLVKGGRLVAFLGVNYLTPHAFEPEEIELIKEVGERTWAAVERARAEAALRASEDRLRLVTDSVPALVSYIDAGLHYRFANKHYDRWFGRRPEVGMHLRDFLGDAAFERLRPHAESARAGRRQSFEAEVPFKQGGTRHVQSEFVPDVAPDGSVAGYYALVTDVTARKRIEDVLLEKEKRQAFLLELSDSLRPLRNAVEIMATVSEKVGRHFKAGRCGYAEVPPPYDHLVVARDWTDGTMASLQGRWPLASFGEPYISQYRSGQTVVVEDALNDDRSREHDNRIGAVGSLRSSIAATLIKEGQWVANFYVQDTKPRRWTQSEIDLVEDVAERTWSAIERARAEEALRQSELRLQLATEATELAVFEWDVQSDRVIANDRLYEQFALRRDEPLTSRRLIDRLHPEDRESTEAQLRQAMNPASSGRYSLEYRLAERDADGERWILCFGQVYFEGTGTERKPVRVLGTTLDTSTRKRAEAALRESERQLREASRAKDDFLAMLGHELRNPLAPIVSTLELMRMEGGRKFSKEREMMVRQARHLAALLDDLLDVSRLARGKIELDRKTIALDELVHRAVEATGPLVEQRRHRLRVDVTPGLLVHADEKRMVQVISNLLTNAAHYTPPCGHLEVTGRRDGQSVVMRVRDNGVGISADLLPSVFERFKQGPRAQDRSDGGVGLGLTIVGSLVELHGGTVTVASEGAGKGSELTVRLPAVRARRASRRPARPEARGSRTTAAGHRILLVDDNRDIVDVVAVILGKAGNTVEKAYDGLTALEVANRFQPTIAILDIGLPDMSGHELAKRLRTQKGLAGVKLVAMTGYGAEADRQRSKQAGFSAHLSKPVELDVLLATIERISTHKGAQLGRRIGGPASKPPARRAPRTTSATTGARSARRRGKR